MRISIAFVAVCVLAVGCGKKKPEADPAVGSAGSGSAGAGSAAAQVGGKASAKVAQQFDDKCVAGDQEACRNLAVLYSEGIGVVKDAGKAAALFGQACNGGNLAACNQIALALTEGMGVAKDPAKAIEIYERTCTGGYALACRNLGLMFRDGRGVPADLERAAKLLEQACISKAPFACTNAGDLDAMRAGMGDAMSNAETHFKQMIAHYKRGCDDGDPTSCRQMGIAYLQGRGLPKSTTAAGVWLERGCRAKDSVACVLLEKLGGKGSAAGAGSSSGGGSGSAAAGSGSSPPATPPQ